MTWNKKWETEFEVEEGMSIKDAHKELTEWLDNEPFTDKDDMEEFTRCLNFFELHHAVEEKMAPASCGIDCCGWTTSFWINIHPLNFCIL